MAYSTQNIDFSTDTGYNYDNTKLEFVGGIVRAKSAFTGASIVVTPTLSISAWNDIGYIDISLNEHADSATARYYHLWLVSFESGASADPSSATWKRYSKAGWEIIAYTEMSSKGMTVAQVETIYEWPTPSYLTFAVQINRESGSTIGQLDNIAIYYTTTAANEDQSSVFATEPASNADLATDLAVYPEFALPIRYVSHDSPMDTPDGYSRSYRQATLVRTVLQGIRFRAITSTERDNTVTFLNAHLGQASFTWNPPGLPTGKKWVAAEPVSVVKVGPSCWDVTTPYLMEVFPTA